MVGMVSIGVRQRTVGDAFTASPLWRTAISYQPAFETTAFHPIDGTISTDGVVLERLVLQDLQSAIVDACSALTATALQIFHLAFERHIREYGDGPDSRPEIFRYEQTVLTDPAQAAAAGDGFKG